MDNDKIGDNNDKSVENQVLFDMLMMVLLTGKERSENEWAKLQKEWNIYHDQTYNGLVMENTFHDYTYKSVVVECALSTTKLL